MFSIFWARGGMVDAADLKAIDFPINSKTLYDNSPFVHGRFSAPFRPSHTKNLPAQYIIFAALSHGIDLKTIPVKDQSHIKEVS